MTVLWVVAVVVSVVVLLAAGSLLYTRWRPTVVEKSIHINATPAQVWAALVDLAAYPDWNPFIVASTGEVRVGARLGNTLRNHGSTMTFSPEILVVDPDRELRWIGRFGVPGVVDGEHYFLIEPTGPARVTFTQGERFAGALVPFAGAALDVADGFDAMNDALRRRVE